ICTRTGNLANYSFRKSNNDALVLLGETESYEPLSRGAFYKAMLKERVGEMDVDIEDVTASIKKSDV
ncbi:MAG TPA: thymidine kinase, partial [Pricia sp.]|nr:thymidine kinase [Pricia sp.]